MDRNKCGDCIHFKFVISEKGRKCMTKMGTWMRIGWPQKPRSSNMRPDNEAPWAMMEEFLRKGGLLAPSAYWAFKNTVTAEEYSQVCNGMGPAGGNLATKALTRVLGDRILWVNLKPSADIHDFMYFARYGRRLSDEIFLFNLFSLIGDKSACCLTRIPRKVIAAAYYICVFWFGGVAYKRAEEKRGDDNGE